MVKKISGGMIVFGVIGLLLLATVAFGVMQTQLEEKRPLTDGEKAAECGLATTLTINAVNALSAGTTVSPSYTAKINGGVAKTFTSGTTTLSPGDVVEILANLTNSIDVIATSEAVVCGHNELDLELYATNNVAAVEIFNDDGDKVTDDVAGGATNQTNLAEGEALTVEVKFKGTNEQSTGDLIYIVEAGSAANITAITMSGNAEKLTAIPSVHTTQVAGSKVVAFRIPAIIGAVTQTYDMTFTLGSGKDLTGGIYTDVYSEQAFADDDGTFKTGVQDASGDSKYEDTSDSDFYVNAA